MSLDWVQPNEFLEVPILDPNPRTDQVWVLFRVLSDALDPAGLTARIGVTPRRSERKGEYTEEIRGSWSTGCWELVLWVTDGDLDAGFSQLLDVLEPHGAFLRALKDARMWLQLHTVLGDTPEWADGLSPRTMSRIAALGARRTIDLTCGRCY